MTWMMVVHHDEEVQDFVRSSLRTLKPRDVGDDGPQQAVRIERARNLEHAQESLDELGIEACELLVLGAATPPNRETSVGASTRAPTEQFIGLQKERCAELPILVLSSNPDLELRGFLRGKSRTAWVDFKTDTNWQEDLAKEAQDLILGNENRVGGMMEVDIRLGDSPAWKIRHIGRNRYGDFGQLPLSKKKLDRVIEQSCELQGKVNAKQWRKALSRLSEDLGSLLFDNAEYNDDFWVKFTEHRADYGGMGRMRISFTVDERTHPVFVEALRYGSAKKYWMLTSPILRRYNASNVTRLPLFQGEGSRTPVNCLVIGADPGGGVIGSDEYGPLDSVGKETGDIEALLSAKHANGIGEVHRFDIGAQTGKAAEVIGKLYAKLAERPWHLVHFAGHVGFVPRGLVGGPMADKVIERDDQVGALILSPSRRIAIDAVNFVNKLEDAQFLYLNSCRSADNYLLANAARERIPAVLGFRWTVGDESAATFASIFYTKLFSRGRCYKSLEYAFRDARSATHKNDENDPTWASPVLMMLRQAEAA
jgi:hypothetical protein